MASPGNPNKPGGGPFDMNKFFKPTTPATTTVPAPNPNPQNVNSFPFPPSSYPLLPSASYPPPTAGPQSYLPQASGFLPPQFHRHVPPYPQHRQQQDNQFVNMHHQRSIHYPAPSLPPPTPHQFQPPHNPSPTPNHGARLMALLSAPPSTFEIPPQQQQATMPMSIPPTIQPTSSGGSDKFMPHNVPILPSGPNINQEMISHSSPMRMLSSKLPRGRHLIGDHLLYDIDVMLPGEVHPQLEVTPITKYGSDPGLVLGRQIAFNKTYICYGLKLGAIRVLNINTALRSLFKGLSQRVTDMAFFAEDVHLLASASTDGRIYVWKITEGPDEEDKPQITGNIIIAIHVIGAGEYVHPQVCWHCHKQEVLVVGIGKHVLKIDTSKVGRSEVQSAENPIICPVDDLIDGVQLVGIHDGEVTDLSMSQWMATRLACASADGTVKIWEDRKLLPIAVLRPYDGQPVNSVRFLTAPHRPDHIILITGGSLNREVKIWASESEGGWLLPSDTDSWQCTQVLELRSSAVARVEEAFFNQIVALSQAGLLLLANAKKNAIYAIHLEYGPNPAATHMDYIAEFTVTMPILSFTGTSDILPQGEQILQVYCVQTQAIQQYSLELSQCLPPPMENMVLDRSDSNVSCDAAKTDGFSTLQTSGNKVSEMSLPTTASKPSVHETSSKSAFSSTHVSSVFPNTNPSKEFCTLSMDSRAVSLPLINSNSDMACGPSPHLPLSPKLSRKLSELISPSNRFEPGPPFGDHDEDHKSIEYSVEQQEKTVNTNLSDVPSLNDDLRSDENKIMQDDMSACLNHPVKFKHPMHLITPSEILMGNSASEINTGIENKSEEQNFQDVVINNDTCNIEVDVKVVGETGFSLNNEPGSPMEAHSFVSENKEKTFYSQASNLGIQMAKDVSAFSTSYVMEEAKEVNNACRSETVAQSSSTKEVVHDSTKVVSGKVVDSSMPATGAQQSVPSGKGKRQKGKNNQGSDPSSPSPSAFNSTDSLAEPGISSSIPSAEAVFSQILAMQETLNQLGTLQKEINKQMTVMVAVPVTKECRRVEASLGRSMEKVIKANVDALWARFQEENAKHENLVRDRTQQLLTSITNCMSKDLPAALEKIVKKELTAIGPAVARTIAPAIEKTVSTAIVEVIQKGMGDKAINQLEKSVNSKLEATVARQIQAQFQTSGKQALQEALKFTLEASLVPAFEVSCKAMVGQVDATFQKGIVEHTAASQEQFDSMHSPLVLALRDAINSASSITQTLSGELADGQRKLLALAIAGTSPKGVNTLVSQLSNGPLIGLHEKIEAPLDPTKKISRMISERKFEEAFTVALQRSDVSIVSWLCSQVDLQGILSTSPLPLSQGVLLSLLQQLACDISNDTPQKLSWMRDVIVAINPADPRISVHVRPIFDQVYQILNHHRGLPSTSNVELSSIRVVMHVINSILMTCK